MMEEDITDMHLFNERNGAQCRKSKSGNPADMSEQEMSQHLSLCLKLAAENKINTKNAFGLHLIDIMRHMVKSDASDLQTASMSLQASAKIYAGRVEALYKDTFAFHTHLQTIVSNKKAKEDKCPEDEGFDIDDEDRREKKKTSKPKQTYIATEESVNFKSEVSLSNSKPHANYITIKRAFTASRTDPKLLEGLTIEDDSNKISCMKANLCFNPQKPAPITEVSYSEKFKAIIKKALELRLNCTEYSSAITNSDVFFDASKRSPLPPPPEFDVNNSDDSFCIGSTPPPMPEQDDNIEEIIERFSVMDITADLFANEVSLAIVNEKTVDRHLLPPNSALKRILNTAEKRKKPPVEKPKKEKPPKEPFFNKQRVVDKSILCKGRKINLTDNDILKWRVEDTIDLRFGDHEEFSTVFAEHFDEANPENNAKISKALYKVLYEKVQESFLSCYFVKKLQPWNQSKHQINPCLIRPSSFGGCLRNENESKEMSATSETNSNEIVHSFGNLSIHNSPAGSGDEGCQAPDFDDVPEIYSPEPPQRKSRLSGFFEDDLKSIMVTPPELVKPINVKFQTEPITLNTEKVKNALWNCIEKVEVSLLSDVHEKLKIVFCKHKLPLQYVFTMLLLLSNEKCLLLQNHADGTDIEIRKDNNEL